MKPVLLDTNVYISAVVFGGVPATALQLIEALGLDLAISDEIEAEFVQTLEAKFGWNKGRIRDASKRLWSAARRVRPAEVCRVVRDAADDHVIGAAVAAGAAFIVTGDRDLLVS